MPANLPPITLDVQLLITLGGTLVSIVLAWAAMAKRADKGAQVAQAASEKVDTLEKQFHEKVEDIDRVARAAHNRLDGHSEQQTNIRVAIGKLETKVEAMPGAVAQQVLTSLGVAGVIERRER